MAGFERYYGAQTYSPKNKLGDDSLVDAQKTIVNSVDKLNVKNVLNANSYQSKTVITAQYSETLVKFAEAIPYVQLSHSLDSVRSYGWEAHFSNDLIEGIPIPAPKTADGDGGTARIPLNKSWLTEPSKTTPNQRPLTLAVKSFSGLKFSSDEATPIGVFGLGNTGNFYLKNPKSGSFTLTFDDLLDANIGDKLFGMYLGGKGLPFNIDLYKFDGQKTLKTHFFMKDVRITSIKQSDLVYSNSRDFSTYEVECIVAPTNFYVSGKGTVVEEKDTRDDTKSISPTSNQSVDTTGSS